MWSPAGSAGRKDRNSGWGCHPRLWLTYCTQVLKVPRAPGEGEPYAASIWVMSGGRAQGLMLAVFMGLVPLPSSIVWARKGQPLHARCTGCSPCGGVSVLLWGLNLHCLRLVVFRLGVVAWCATQWSWVESWGRQEGRASRHTLFRASLCPRHPEESLEIPPQILLPPFLFGEVQESDVQLQASWGMSPALCHCVHAGMSLSFWVE